MRVAAAVLLLVSLLAQSQGLYRRHKGMLLENTLYYQGLSLVFFETVVNSTTLDPVNCTIFSNRKMAVHKSRDSMVSANLVESQFREKIRLCENITGPGLKERLRASRGQSNLPVDFRKVLAEHAYSVYPGTKWCGTGTLAITPSELGHLRSVDACCKDHSRCFDSLQPDEERHSLANRDFYPRRHCKCDQKLFKCLRNLAPNEDSDLVGHMYFNVLQMECFEKDLPKACVGHDADGLCSSYEYKKGYPRYQWFSNPPFLARDASLEPKLLKKKALLEDDEE